MKTHSSLAERSRGGEGEVGVKYLAGRGTVHCLSLLPSLIHQPTLSLPSHSFMGNRDSLIPSPLGWCLLLAAALPRQHWSLLPVLLLPERQAPGLPAAEPWPCTHFPSENRTPHLREFWPFPNVCWLPLSFLKASYWCLVLIGKCKQEIDKG